jgi:hypothetical protein
MASGEEGEQQEQYRRRQRRRSSGEQHSRVVHVGECPTAAEAERLQIPKRWERRGAHQRHALNHVWRREARASNLDLDSRHESLNRFTL